VNGCVFTAFIYYSIAVSIKPKISAKKIGFCLLKQTCSLDILKMGQASCRSNSLWTHKATKVGAPNLFGSNRNIGSQRNKSSLAPNIVLPAIDRFMPVETGAQLANHGIKLEFRLCRSRLPKDPMI